MGFEPTTPTLARLYSTTELHPHYEVQYQKIKNHTIVNMRIKSQIISNYKIKFLYDYFLVGLLLILSLKIIFNPFCS